MARRRRGRRSRGGRRYGRRGRRGFRFPKLMDIGQGVYNAEAMGGIEAAQKAINGDLTGAGTSISSRISSVPTMVNLAVGNVVIGFNRKIIRWAGGSFVRRYIA